MVSVITLIYSATVFRPGRTQKIFGAYETAFFAAKGWFYSMAYILIMGLYTQNMSDAPYMQPDLALLFVLVGVLNNLRTPCDQLISAAGHCRSGNKPCLQHCRDHDLRVQGGCSDRSVPGCTAEWT